MSYIWENYNKNNKYILSSKDVGLNEEANFAIKNNIVHVNSKSRFCSLLKDIEDSNIELHNCLFHYLAQLDLICGHSTYDNQYSDILTEIENGKYGKKIKSSFELISSNDITLLLNSIITYRKSQNNNNMFYSTFKQIFNSYSMKAYSAEIFFDKSKNTNYCFCATNETPYLLNLFNLIKLLFANIDEMYIPIWGVYNFGIIGNLNHSIPIIDRCQIID